MHVHWNYAVCNHCAQLPKHAINDCWRTYEVGRWAPATGPRTMLIAQSTTRIFLPNRRLLRQCFDEQNHHGHRHDMLHNKGSTGLSRLLHEITVQNHSKAMPNLFWQTSKTTPCWIKGRKHNHRYYYPGHVYNWISVEPGPGYTRHPDMPRANTPAHII